nr:hypothetical protein CFP56_12079 [Quercus suber]
MIESTFLRCRRTAGPGVRIGHSSHDGSGTNDRPKLCLRIKNLSRARDRTLRRSVCADGRENALARGKTTWLWTSCPQILIQLGCAENISCWGAD